MKKYITLISTLLWVCTLGFLLTGCDSLKEAEAEETDARPAVCFVIGATANAQAPNFNSPLVQDTILDCAKKYGFVAIVNADGDSEIVAAESLDIDDKYKQASEERLEMDARNKADSVIQFMSKVRADDPEVDYLEALRLACRTLNSLEGYHSKTIIVLGTGLSPKGYMNYCNNLMSADSDTIADLLEEKKAIPDFSAITGVYWQGMGDVAAPQKDLTPAQNSKLYDDWKAVIERGGSELISNQFPSSPVNESGEYPSVTVVDLPDETPVEFEADSLTGNQGDVFDKPVMLTEEQVMFVPDQAVYLHPEEAAEILAPIASYIAEHEEMTLLLAGTTAGDEDSVYTARLSQERAETVKHTLVDLGVKEEKLYTVGLGSSNPWHIKGAGYEGDLAAQNRKVVLIDASTELAQELMN